ncbi:MAG: hypothetical protein M1814_006337 [Vezdaea aestivalis]|nr:MAG: hypothetical protein M1814_006337 [Vezdaea aestivalis]
MVDNEAAPVPPKTRRRRSLGFLMTLSTATDPDPPAGEAVEIKKKTRPLTSLLSRSPKNPDSPLEGSASGSNSPRLRPRTLLKSGRPASLFDSLRSSHSADEREKLTATSTLSSLDAGTPTSGGPNVQLYGDVHVSGGMFGKRKEFLVLTETHLVRFKNRARAQEVYASIPGSLSRAMLIKHTSFTSIHSLQDSPTVTSISSAEVKQGIQLNQIVAISRLDDGRPTFSIEVAHLEDEISHASSMIIQIGDPKDADLWLSSIRGAATKARLTDPSEYTKMTVERVVAHLDLDRDYDPHQFKLYKVVQRISGRSMSRSSEDPSKSTASVKYLAVGAHKVHLIPLQDTIRRTSSNVSAVSAMPAVDLASQASFGLMTLVSISVRASDDVFELRFRLPLNTAVAISLSSVSSTDIVTHLRQMLEYLRPNWVHQPFNFSGPRHLQEEPAALSSEPGDYGSFDRTLVAYSAAYMLDTSAIRYAIDVDVEDGPLVTLLPPGDPNRADYALLELLAFFRALRFNQSFHSVSFGGINLQILHGCKDFRGTDHLPFLTRSGQPLSIVGHESLSLLIQEIQGLAVSNMRLRRMDFSYCIERRAIPDSEDPSGSDPGSEICQAIFPLCRRGITNVDWITLNGIDLDDSDLDYLVDAAVERSCHFRALEISSCSLTDRSLQLILNAMLSQDATLESIDLSNNLARLSPATFQSQIGHFGLIRKLNLSRVQRTRGPEPLVAPETLLTWRLEELHFSQTQLNEQTVDSISAYLASTMSDTLKELHLNQCGLTGNDLAVFMHSMTRNPGTARKLHLLVSENRLEVDHDKFVDAVSKNMGPSHLTMKMVEYQKEDHFRELIGALQRNQTLTYLDISKASLPYDANHDTCEALQKMFALNTTLEILDISGEHAHLETAKFGIGLNHALLGLVHNKTLSVLRIEYQKLGLQGASTLSTVLESNTTLREIFCEHNDINLQGLTVLVNALQHNRAVTYLPPMHSERHRALGTLRKEADTLDQHEPSLVPANRATSTIRRGLAAVNRTTAPRFSSSSSRPPPQSSPLVQPPTTKSFLSTDPLLLVAEKWDKQVTRLDRYLLRNFNLQHDLFSNSELVLSGFVTDDEDDESKNTDNSKGKRSKSTKAGKKKEGIELLSLSTGTTPREEKDGFLFSTSAPAMGGLGVGRDKENKNG